MSPKIHVRYYWSFQGSRITLRFSVPGDNYIVRQALDERHADSGSLQALLAATIQPRSIMNNHRKIGFGSCFSLLAIVEGHLEQPVPATSNLTSHGGNVGRGRREASAPGAQRAVP